MIEPKEIEINGRKFIISKFPSVAGLEIVSRYWSSALPKIGNHQINFEMMHKMMCFVGVKSNDKAPLLMLTTTALIDNHTGNWETLLELIKILMEYNCSFFLSGRISTFFQDIAQKIPESIAKILIALSQQLSQKEKQPSMNSEQSTV